MQEMEAQMQHTSNLPRVLQLASGRARIPTGLPDFTGIGAYRSTNFVPSAGINL